MATTGTAPSLVPERPSRAEQLTTFFRFPEYIRAVGGQLTQYNVLDYFSKSDFYESGCNNAILQMQSAAANWGSGPIASAAALAGTQGETSAQPALSAWERRNDPFAIEQELKRFVGLEFVVVHAKPPDLFVIHKRWRSSPTETRVLDVYYVLQGNITMAADLYTILGSKLLSTISALQSSLTLARNAQPNFNPREGHAWRIAAEAEAEEDSDDDVMREKHSLPQEQQDSITNEDLTSQKAHDNSNGSANPQDTVTRKTKSSAPSVTISVP